MAKSQILHTEEDRIKARLAMTHTQRFDLLMKLIKLDKAIKSSRQNLK
jgi:hypothetical protein